MAVLVPLPGWSPEILDTAIFYPDRMLGNGRCREGWSSADYARFQANRTDGEVMVTLEEQYSKVVRRKSWPLITAIA